MHTQILKDASLSQTKDFVDKALRMIKETNNSLYESLEEYLYKEVYGCHFTEWLLKEALSTLEIPIALLEITVSSLIPLMSMILTML